MWTCRASRLTRFVAVIAGLCGMMFVMLSSTPFPSWFYAAWIILVIGGIAVRRRRLPIVVAIFITCAAIAWQFLYYLPPHLPPHPDDTMYLIGDSISAGIGSPDISCWPELIRRHYRINLVDLSRAGATVQSSLDRTNQIGADSHLVFMEIGGNDVLHETPIAEFEESLATLLSRVCCPDRVVVMMEIPLPPFRSQYGAVQRRLAHRFGVILIPRRFFSDILAGKDATLDGFHLTQTGQDEMARMIGRFISADFAAVR
ncbi:MAG TPA: GDSL-type esterase/lipase family protein [Verrucomicrobiae bacterium]|nr:GDSL-type esterase/lipase family protein [Verrucomicrobiae bacterium]